MPTRSGALGDDSATGSSVLVNDGETFSLVTGGGIIRPDAEEFAPAAVDDKIGTFTIVKCLGAGGMGAVYLAQQSAPVERPVALKLIRAALPDAQALARFESERRAMARLSHPNVAQIYGTGKTAQGQPFFVMEYVAGAPIIDFCDREKMTLPQRLELFRKVCRGVQHAHQNGILHRDLKPSNILVSRVDGHALPKIIDFGIAKAIDQPLEESAVTAEGMLGTPGYLCPEAVRGLDLDTRADVYALGILLNEMLAGARPFAEEDSVIEILRLIVEQDPPAPSRQVSMFGDQKRRLVAEARNCRPAGLRRRLAGDLDWIVGRAIAKHREQRYDSVAELSADVGRHLCDEAVTAGPPSELYRIRKLARRHVGTVVAALLIVGSLAAGLVIRTVEARRANREARAAREVTRFLVDMFEVADPDGAGGAEVTAGELLDSGAARLRDELREQPLIRAQLLDTVGVVYANLGRYGEALELGEEALSLRRPLLADDHPDIASSLEHVGVFSLENGEFAAAERYLEQALAISESRSDTAAAQLAAVLSQLARAVDIQDRHQDASSLLQRALETQERAAPRDELAIARTLSLLSENLQRQRRIDEAERLGSRALEILARELGESHPLVAESLTTHARTAMWDDRFQVAHHRIQRAIAIMESAVGPDSPRAIPLHNVLGLIFEQWGKLDQAEDAYLHVEAVSMATSDVDPFERARGLGGLAAIASRRQDYVTCIARYRQTLSILEREYPDHSTIGWNLSNIADCMMELGRYEEAESTFLESAAVFERQLGAGHPDAIVPIHNLGSVYLAQGDLAKAEATYRKSLASWEAAYGPDHTYVAHSCDGLGDVFSRRAMWAEAVPWYRRALDILIAAAIEPGSEMFQDPLLGLTKALRATGQEAEADVLGEKYPSTTAAPATESAGETHGA